ncbi:MAG: 2,3-bisphosphoglycerate-independent phosphoglycerate mutase [Asgard group archaeon]|nr:2,3-bisphosphoglycerate-independent phosphoglycerate mutase [Asgard group archaeon]
MYKLKNLKSFSGRKGPLLLIIMDGIGIGKNDDGNAVFLTKPKTLIDLSKDCQAKNLYCQLKAHGPAVGLISENDMGNSEVGHNALGCGQIYDQGAKLVDSSLNSGDLFKTRLWNELTIKVIENKSTVHLIGLLSDGNVHSHINQLFRIIQGLALSNIQNVRIHILTDGRDVPANSALDYVRALEIRLEEINTKYKDQDYNYCIASGGGRMYVTMDRYESNWKIVQRGWYAHVLGVVEKEELTNGYKGYYTSCEEAITHARKCFPDKNDQYLPPFVIVDKKHKPIGTIQDNDLVINFNFRGDRAIQISRAFEEKDFTEFDRKRYPKIDYVGLLEYDGDAHIPKKYLIPPPNIKNVLSDYCCTNDITSFAIAETHKFGHVTYFWNGNRSGYVCSDKEKYVKIESEPNEMIATNPLMKAREVCDKTIEALESGDYRFIRVNFANGDMVGHTGIVNAAIQAVSVVDESVDRLVQAVNKLSGITIITADHGNCEDMKLPDGKPKTAHSLNPVGFWIVDSKWSNEYQINNSLEEPGLSNVAATILNLLGYEKPDLYRDSLVIFDKKN